MKILVWVAVAGVVLAVVYTMIGQNRSVERQAAEMTGGSPSKGRKLVEQYGCGSCHTIPGIRGANALVGPPLNRIGNRVYIAGVLSNTPDHMRQWLRDPPGVDPLTAMPNLHVSDDDARSIAAYLYTLQ